MELPATTASYQARRKSEKTLEEKESSIFSETFLLKRPLLQALMHPKPPVLLIDELDRSDEEFESFCLRSFPNGRLPFLKLEPLRLLNPLCDPHQQPHAGTF